MICVSNYQKRNKVVYLPIINDTSMQPHKYRLWNEIKVKIMHHLTVDTFLYTCQNTLYVHGHQLGYYDNYYRYLYIAGY